MDNGIPVLFPTPSQETHLPALETNELTGSGQTQLRVSVLKRKLPLQLQVLVVELKDPVLFLFLRVMHGKHLSLTRMELFGHWQTLEAAM